MAIIERRRELLGEQGPEPGRGLENYTWKEISYISKTGNPSKYGISVGDTKNVTLNGIFGDNDFTNKTVGLIVIGINHNSAIEGNGITFQLYKAENINNVALVTANLYNYYTSSYNDYVVNTTNTNTGGWASSYARTTLMPAFKAILPSALQAVIKSTTKYTDNTGGGSDVASYVTPTSDECFLLAEYEICGFRSYANTTEQNYQIQYAFYANGGTRLKYTQKATSYLGAAGAAVGWWERSVDSTHATHVCEIYSPSSGLPYGANPNYSAGIVPAFRV